ncbi:unnamed protein product, partial [Porites evermanni]
TGLRGFHVYKEIWKPIVGELLRCSHERKNIYDRYAIAAKKRLLTDENYRRSPLIQGGLEIPVGVICEMDDTPRNRAIMER